MSLFVYSAIDRSKSCFNGDLPSELLPDILSYLPLKDLLKFRSVSRLWKSIIGDPSFSSLHLIHCPNNTKNPYLIFAEGENLYAIFEEGKWIPRPRPISDRWVLRHSKTYRKASKVEFPGDVNKKWQICSALDGLVVLLADQYMLNQKEDSIILWNPSIRKSINLQPPPPSPWMQMCRELMVYLALLYESSSDDYKVLMIRYVHDFYGKSVSAPLFDLFSLKSFSWLRVVDSHSVTNGLMFSYKNVSIGGSTYWIVSNEYIRSQDQVKKESIISFHLRLNMFSSTPLPTIQFAWDKKLIVLPESTLGLLVLFNLQLIKIWAMERSIGAAAFDGSETSKHCWTERYKIQLEIPVYEFYERQFFFVPIQMRNILLLWEFESLSSYDLDIDELEHVIKNYLYTPNYIGPYVESLLLLEHVANPELDSAVLSTCT